MCVCSSCQHVLTGIMFPNISVDKIVNCIHTIYNLLCCKVRCNKGAPRWHQT